MFSFFRNVMGHHNGWINLQIYPLVWDCKALQFSIEMYACGTDTWQYNRLIEKYSKLPILFFHSFKNVIGQDNFWISLQINPIL